MWNIKINSSTNTIVSVFKEKKTFELDSMYKRNGSYMQFRDSRLVVQTAAAVGKRV